MKESAPIDHKAERALRLLRKLAEGEIVTTTTGLQIGMVDYSVGLLAGTAEDGSLYVYMPLPFSSLCHWASSPLLEWEDQ